MPYENEHAARLKNPEMQHLRVRRTNGSGDAMVQGVKIPDNISVIWYIIETTDGEAPIPQSLRFNKNEWSEQEAKAFIEKNKIKVLKFEEAEDKKTNLFYSKNVNNGIADLLLYGTVGEDNKIDGDVIASEIYYLNSIGVKKINVRINSPGGSVYNGYSAFAAMLNSQAEIHTYNDGIAASMGAMLLMAGKKIYMADYAEMMIHEPAIGRHTIDSTKDEKIKSGLIRTRDNISLILQQRTGKGKDEIDTLLKEETWFNAEEAKEHGFIDEIFAPMKRPAFNSEMSISEKIMSIAALYNEQPTQSNTNTTNLQKNNKKMELLEIGTSLGLKDANKENIINAINDLKVKSDSEKDSLNDKINELEQNANNLQAKIDEQKETIDALNLKLDENKKNALDNLINQGIEKGLFNANEKQTIADKFENNLDGLKYVIENSKPQRVSITDQLNTTNQSTDPREKWDFDTWSKEDPKGLKEMKDTNIDKYNELGRSTYGAGWVNEKV